MYSRFSTYLDARIAEVNSLLSGNDFVKIDIDLNGDELPDNQKHNRYILKFEDYGENPAYNGSVYDLNAVIELKFLIPNSDATKYQGIVDNYVHNLVKAIQDTPQYSPSSTWSMEILRVSARKLNEFEEGEYKPEILFEAKVIDAIPLGLSVPSAPTLTAPADGSTTGTLDQAFNWTGTADSWDITISQNGTAVLTQTGLTTSSYTVPLDNLLTNGATYTWAARGRNSAGLGTQATAFTFTVNDNNYDVDFTTWLTGLSAEPTSARKTLNNNLIADLRTDGIWTKLDSFIILAAETSEHSLKNWKPNTQTVVAIGSPTFTVDRGYTTNGSSSYLRTRSAPAYLKNYSQNDASFGLYVNTDVNESTNAVDFGSGSVFSLLFVRWSNNSYFSINDGGSTPNIANTNAIGFYTVDRQASGSYKTYKNGSNTSTQSISSTGVSVYDFYIGARNLNGTADRFAAKRYAFAYLGKGLSASEHSTLYSRISTYLTAIGAN